MSDPAAQLFGVGGLSPASSGLGQGAGPEVAAGSALVTGALSIDAQLKAGREAKREARNQAAEVKQIAEEEAALEGRRTARLLASARAGFAGAGFEFAGSPLIFLRQIELEGEEQIGLIRSRAERAAGRFRKRGRVAESLAKRRAISTGVSAGFAATGALLKGGG